MTRTTARNGHAYVSVTSAMALTKTLLGEELDYYGSNGAIHAAEGEGCHRVCLDWLAARHGLLPDWGFPKRPEAHPDQDRWDAVLSRCLHAFRSFVETYQVEPIGIEQEDFSSTFGLVGHIDLPAYFTIPCRRRMRGPIDLKFVKAVQESHRLQVRCYGRLDGMRGSQIGGIFHCNRDTGAWNFVSVDLTAGLEDVMAASYAAKLWAWGERKRQA
jgi:hypothetical protein